MAVHLKKFSWRNNEETDGGGVFMCWQGDFSLFADGFVVKPGGAHAYH